MLQLRNRYHIEKRRIESLQAEFPKRIIETKWPLYGLLSFLSDHIPVRRSFRTMNCRRTYGEFAVKNEMGTDIESEGDQRDDGEYLPGSRKGSLQVRSYGSLIPPKIERNTVTRPQNMPIRNSTYVPSLPRITRPPPQVYVSQPQILNQRSEAQMRSHFQSTNQMSQGAEKFLAFGRFLTSSLIELPESEALLLVNQFTTELVQSYLKKHDQNQSRENEIYVETNGHVDNFQAE